MDATAAVPVRFAVAKAEGNLLQPSISLNVDTLSERSDDFSRDEEPSR